MSERRSLDIRFRGDLITVQYSVCGRDESVGIMGDCSEDHTLHDLETDERLTYLEETVTDEEWDQIALAVDSAGGCEYEPLGDEVI
jgi:hypothetical protein